MARLVVALAEDRARVNRRRHALGELGVDPGAALLRDAELLAEQRLRRGRAEADEHARPHDGELGLEPRPAGRLLGPARLRVDPPLASGLPLEVLDHVRDIRLVSRDPGSLERLVEQPARRADERAALPVLLV